MRPRSAFWTACGCSKISLSMKCSNSPLSAGVGVPLDAADLAVDGARGEAADLEVIARDDGDVEIVQIDHVARVSDDGVDVAREEVLALADAKHQRRAASRADQQLRVVPVHDGDAVGAGDFAERAADGLDEALVAIAGRQRVVIMAGQLREHLACRCRRGMCGPAW